MTELERALVRLGDELAFPEAPDVSQRVLARLETGRAPRRRPGRRALVLVAAALAVAIAAAMAVPQARTAILELFHLRGATVQRVDTLPAATGRVLGLGQAAPLDEDGRPDVAPPEALVPTALGPPTAVYVSREPYGRRLTLVYEPGDGVPRSPYTGVGLLVSEFVGDPDPGFVHKLIDSGATLEELTVGEHPALWIEDGPHTVLFKGAEGLVYEDRGRLAGNTLLVDRGDVLVRIEGEIDQERAVEIAESLG
jgi:hypothetical protein